MYKVLNIGEKMYREGFVYSKDPIHGDWDLIVSYRYRHKLGPEFLTKYRCVNLHTSYLPYNKGAYPIFFAIWDNTPLGVTVHLMDEGIDSGNILLQRKFDVRPYISLEEAWQTLNIVVQNLLYDNLATIVNPNNMGDQQSQSGTIHTKREFEKIQLYLKDGWDTLVGDIPKIKALYYIDKIEQVRARNNINWMEVLRVAVKADPTNTIPLIRKISQCDNEINELLKQI